MSMLYTENIMDRTVKITCRIIMFTGLAQAIPGNDQNVGLPTVLQRV